MARSKPKPAAEQIDRLRALVARILDALDTYAPAERWKAVSRLRTYVVIERAGKPALCDTPRAVWKTSAGFEKAFAARGPAIEGISLPLLTAIEPDAALPCFEDFLRGEWAAIEMGTPEHGLLVSLSEPWSTLAPRIRTEAMVELFRARRVRLGGLTEAQLAALPLDELIAHVREFDFTSGLDDEVKRIFTAVGRAPAPVLAELWLAGRAPERLLTPEVVAEVPIDGLVRALRDDTLGWLHADDAQRFCARHPALRTVDASFALLDRIGDATSHAACAFTSHLVRIMVSQRHQPAVPLLRRLRAAAGDRNDVFTDALFNLGDAVTLDEVAATLAPTVSRLRPSWDPHHTAPELRAPVRAVFARAREHAAAAFASYFTDAALRSEKGAKIALDILLLGQGTIVDHDGTSLRKPGEDWLSLDPAWAAVVDRLRDHARLGPTARRLARQLAGNDARNAASAVRAKRAPKKSLVAKERAGKTSAKKATSTRNQRAGRSTQERLGRK